MSTDIYLEPIVSGFALDDNFAVFLGEQLFENMPHTRSCGSSLERYPKKEQISDCRSDKSLFNNYLPEIKESENPNYLEYLGNSNITIASPQRKRFKPDH